MPGDIISPLIAVLLLSSTLGVRGSQYKSKPASHAVKESCDQCTARHKKICELAKSLCALRAAAAYDSLRQRCGHKEDCAAAAEEAFDEEGLACGQEAEGCALRAAYGCRQCQSGTEAEPRDTCVSREETICGDRERAGKATAKAEYYIALNRCGPENKDCVRLVRQAYENEISACVLAAQACSLAATDRCTRSSLAQPPKPR
jgi:hypothetical protein